MPGKKSKNTKPNNTNKGLTSVIHYIKSKKVHFIVGLLIFMFILYLSVATLSFFFTGNEDQSIIENMGLKEVISQKRTVSNWAGVFGAYLAYILINRWFGIASVFMLFFVASLSFKLMQICTINVIRRFMLCSLSTIWLSVLLAFVFYGLKTTTYYIGGLHGFKITEWLINNTGYIGVILLLICGFVMITVFFNSKTITVLKSAMLRQEKSEKGVLSHEDFHNNITIVNEEKPIEESIRGSKHEATDNYKDIEDANFKIEIAKADEDESYDHSDLGVYDPRLDLSSYKFPEIGLLRKYEMIDNQVDKEEQTENRNRIQKTLEEFGINIVSIKATVGPTITLYEVVPDRGVRIARIRSLEDDIALSLSALGIRIIAPMPGKGTIGIEVPNKKPQIVSMESVISSRKYGESKDELPIVLGRTITNEVFMFDLTKMPHLLVAGATGQGKSVGLNAIITSLLYKKHPAELKFVLVDPKMVEFNIYEGIEKHYLAKLIDMDTAIITDFTKVIDTLKSLCKEMDNRYKLLTEAHVRNISEYNTKFISRQLNPEKGHKYLPYIVVVIDEFGDLIMTAGKEIEMPIIRIAQKARAVGMHMIIATQRPTTNIITGVIKANFPARIGFKVVSMTDSRTILDAPGANKLVGRGDLLFSQGNEMTRVQCALINTDEIEKIVNNIGEQLGYEHPYILPEVFDEGADGTNGNIDLANKDPLFEDAARMIVLQQQGSASNIQRKFSIGYNRAGRLMDQLQAAGIVSENDGNKGRQVLIQDEMQLEQLLNRLQNK